MPNAKVTCLKMVPHLLHQIEVEVQVVQRQQSAGQQLLGQHEVTQNKRKRKPDPEWVTRFSIRTRGNDFMDKVDQMALKAGNYFGRESGRLIRDYQGDIEIGDLQIVESDVEEQPEND